MAVVWDSVNQRSTGPCPQVKCDLLHCIVFVHFYHCTFILHSVDWVVLSSMARLGFKITKPQSERHDTFLFCMRSAVYTNAKIGTLS